MADVAVRRALLRWFRRRARPLPWRDSGSPYAVWVSEVMLQQTQIATVIPYYKRFMERFPTVERLAAAPLERVLELWSGLGYYRRARLMRQAAQEIVTRLGGEFPADYDVARSLPGIGDYTARAVLSMGCNQPFTVLDGNVARVIARLRARRGNIHQKAFRRAVERDLAILLSRRLPGDFNQALMQLGQLVCLPRRPRCQSCPLKSRCRARLLGAPEDFPQPRPRRAPQAHFLATAVIRRGNRLALVRGLCDGLLSDLWNFPAAFGPTNETSRNSLDKRLKRMFPHVVLPLKPVAELRHSITHRKIHVGIYLGELSAKRKAGGAGRSQEGSVPRRRRDERHEEMRWASTYDMRTAAISRLAEKILKTVL